MPLKKNSLTETEKKDFHQKGFIGPFTLYEPEEMDEIFKQLRRQLIDSRKAVYQSKFATSGVTNLTNYDRHLDIEFLFQHICRQEIVARLYDILGPDILCWRTEFFPKYPGDEGTDWHQVKRFSAVSNKKKPYIEWPQDSDFSGAINVWTAFTESRIDNGCLRIVPGTHGISFYDESKEMLYDTKRINQVEKDGKKMGFFGYDFSDLQIDSDWKPNESEAVSLEMKAGQFVIFWSTLLHASHPHLGKTKDMRLGYTARYVPTSVKIYPDTQALEEFGGKASLERYRAVLVSGKDEFHHNKVISHFGEEK